MFSENCYQWNTTQTNIILRQGSKKKNKKLNQIKYVVYKIEYEKKSY